MFGKTRKGYAYYTCQPQLDRVGDPSAYADHPRSVYVREDKLLECVQTFFNQRVFGPDRTELLRHWGIAGHSYTTRNTPKYPEMLPVLAPWARSWCAWSAGISHGCPQLHRLWASRI
jgi:hypothetical protein